MSVTLNRHLVAPARSTAAPNVNPSLGPVGLDPINSRRHGHGDKHHDHSSNVEPDESETEASEDADPDCGEDGDCEQNSIKIS